MKTHTMTNTAANEPGATGPIDLATFRMVLDACPITVASYGNDLEKLYDYVGLPDTGSRSLDAVSNALYERIRTSFESGHQLVWRTCRSLRTDLIREHVLRGVPLDPYFEVLNHLCDAVRSDESSKVIQGDWAAAITAAHDHVAIHSRGNINREMTHAREFAVARAAKALQLAGFEIDLSAGRISLTEASEIKLAETIEAVIRKMGGLNVARRIFAAIAPAYDPIQGRYHLVPPISSTGGGTAQVPWGYLLQFAVKHIEGERPLEDSDRRWDQLCGLATAFAAVIDVQYYTHMAWGTYDAAGLLQFLRDLALYDALFRVHQLRPSDVERLARGMLDFVDPSIPTARGWTLDQALAVIGHILDPIHDIRGPVILSERDISKALPTIPRLHVQTILKEVLCHPTPGPNQHFSRPTDAPTSEDQTLGITFGGRPLLKLGSRYCLVDRSVCAPAFLEALLTSLRPQHRKLDDNVGLAVERFVERELAAHGVPTISGDYDHKGASDQKTEHGECDLIAETPSTLIFFELKKKALTRRARAGMDADLLLDLAGSLLQAHAQLGWHEVRLLAAGKIDLVRDGVASTLSLNDRDIEKFATSMLDYGSFQDRMVLKHFLEATMNAAFHPHDTRLVKKFDKINASLAELREQIALKYPDQTQINQPFFSCWFISVPQLLVMLDEVHDPVSFRSALWTCRSFTTGAADLYYELSYMRKIQAASTPHI